MTPTSTASPDASAYADLEEELGDLWFQILFHAELASEAGQFTIAEVAQGLTDKMIRRHPHVFGDASERTADSQTLAWEEIKAAERGAKGQKDKPQSVLADVERIRNNSMVPSDIPIYGYIYDCKTGNLIEVPEATEAGKAS